MGRVCFVAGVVVAVALVVWLAARPGAAVSEAAAPVERGGRDAGQDDALLALAPDESAVAAGDAVGTRRAVEARRADGDARAADRRPCDYRVRGRLVWEDGSPVASAEVRVSSFGVAAGSRVQHGAKTTTTEDGDFEVELFWSRVHAEAAGSIRLRLETEDPAASGETTYVDAGPHEPVDVGTVRLVRPPEVAQGVVVDEAGRPVADAVVGIARDGLTSSVLVPLVSEGGTTFVRSAPGGTLRAMERTTDPLSTRSDAAGRWTILGDDRDVLLHDRLVFASKTGYLCDGVEAQPPGRTTTVVVTRCRTLQGRLLLPAGVDARGLRVSRSLRADDPSSRSSPASLEQDGTFELVVPEAPGWRLGLQGSVVLGVAELEPRGVEPGPEGRELWAPSPAARTCRVELVDEYGAPFDSWEVGASWFERVEVRGDSRVFLLSSTSGRVVYSGPGGLWGSATVEPPVHRIVARAPIAAELRVELVSEDLADHFVLWIQPIEGASEPGVARFLGPTTHVVDGRAEIALPYAGEWSFSAFVRPRMPRAPSAGMRTRTCLAPVRVEPGRPATVEF